MADRLRRNTPDLVRPKDLAGGYADTQRAARDVARVSGIPVSVAVWTRVADLAALVDGYQAPGLGSPRHPSRKRKFCRASASTWWRRGQRTHQRLPANADPL